MTANETELPSELPLGLCGCGQLLYPSLDSEGKRRGVTHLTADEDEYHCLYFAGMSVESPEQSDSQVNPKGDRTWRT